MPAGDGVPAPYIPLPDAEADPRMQRESTRLIFDQVAGLYASSRPGYPDALFSELRAGPRWPGAAVLEVGCGTGQATVGLAPHAGPVTCVELGPALAARARSSLARFSNVSVVVGAFETVDLPAESFDVVFSATAWHWIDPNVAYSRAAHLLVGGGALALATNAHVAGGTQAEIAPAVAALHSRLWPEVGSWQFPDAGEIEERARRGGTIGEVWARIDRSFETPPPIGMLFEQPAVSAFEWTARYSARGYADMLATQSSYITLDKERRRRLVEGVASLVDEHLGGQVTKDYLAILAVAARR